MFSPNFPTHHRQSQCPQLSYPPPPIATMAIFDIAILSLKPDEQQPFTSASGTHWLHVSKDTLQHLVHCSTCIIATANSAITISID